MRRCAVLALLACVAAGLAAPAQAAETDYSTALRASGQYPGARGHSEYDREGASRQVEVTVRGIAGLAGHRVSVYVAGRKVGTMRVSSSGRAHHEWKTARGDRIPSAGAGSRLTLRTPGGTLIASGTYRRETED